MQVIHLYRAVLRQAGYLPHAYLQAFVKGRTSDCFRRYRNSPEPLKHLSRARADLRRLERVNRGEQKPFMSLLRHAYGRTGKLRHELLQPHLPSSDPTLTPREPVIPSKATSAPPNYPNSLASLLTSARSIATTKPLSAAELLTPRTLPERVLHPSSEEARLLGPFSLRRLANIHHRQFLEQTRRVSPPLQVSLIGGEEGRKVVKNGGIHVPLTGLEEYNPVKALSKLASPLPSSGPSRGKNVMAEREKDGDLNAKGRVDDAKNSSLSLGKVGNRNRRWLRRRYRELLAEVPSITAGALQSNSATKYKVDLASPKLALRHDIPRPLRLVTMEEMEWITKAEVKSTKSRPERAQRRPSMQVSKEPNA